MPDVILLGMGPGGEAVAGQLLSAGLSVVGIDRHLVGGECPYYGCIPSKMLIRAGNALAETRRVPELAGGSEVYPDFTQVARRIREEATSDWDDQVAVERFTNQGGQFVRGQGSVIGPGKVRVSDQEFSADRAIVLNTGTEPTTPPITGLAETPYWTSRDAMRATDAPESLIVLGAGPIGLELAQAFSRFGTTVTVVEMAEQVLPMEEPEAAEVLTGVLANEGIAVHTGTGASEVRHNGSEFAVRLDDRELHAERLLVATGRHTDLAALGLDNLGIDTSQRFVEPDGYLRIADGVYAIGDMTGKGAFTHISVYQAEIAARHILGEQADPAEYHAVPRVTFTDPEVGAVGLTEAQAREDGMDVEVTTTQVPNSARGWIHKAGNEGVIKLVRDPDRDTLVGATSVGPDGGEVLAGLAVAVHAQVPVASLRRMIYAYPTFHRAIQEAL